MKDKGFTLIELLAVIVILAIIAVITVPKIADMISSSRMGGAEDSFYGTLKASELGYTKALQSKTDLKGDTCDLSKVSGDKVTCTNGTVIAFTGKVPEKGILIIDSAGSTIAKEVTLNGYKCYGDLSSKQPCIKTSEEVASETLVKKTVTTGDGLYEDSFDNTRYVFKGSNPNNYLTFNNEAAGFRIVSVEADGTLKIVTETSIGEKVFDSGTNTPGPSGPRLNNQNTYCKIWTATTYYGCNAWNAVNGTYSNASISGTVTKDSEMKTYLNDEYFHSMTSEAQSQIQAHNFNKGGVLYEDTVEDTVKIESKDNWTGNIALLSLGDLLKATTNNSCTKDSTSFWLIDGEFNCSKNNYIVKPGYSAWFLNPDGRENYTHGVIGVGPTGYVVPTGALYKLDTFPAMYLKANIKISGTGTRIDPYTIK